MPEKPITVERLERALAIAAYVVARHGDVYAPIFERLERELEEVRRRRAAADRARAMVAGADKGL
jgi:hypothetical protein